VTAVPDAECGCHKTFKTDSGQVSVVHHMPSALQHYYPLPALEQEALPLFRGRFDADGKQFRGTISLGFDPRPTIDVTGVRDVSFEDLVEMDFLRGSAKWVDRPSIKVRARGVPKPAKTTRIHLPRRTSHERKSWDPAPITVGSSKPVDTLTFFLLNGWRATDGLNTCYDGHDRPGRIQVRLGDWELRIEPRGDVSPDELRRHMRSTGRSTVTHVGRIRRVDLAEFEATDALDVVSCVEAVTSFALGRVVSIVVPVGWRDGKATWTQWSALRAVDRPLGAAPWLDEQVASAQLAEASERGFTLMQDPMKWEVFQRALGYYFSANFEATVTMKVMLPISAMAMLSFAHFVELLPVGHPSRLSKKTWRGLNTEDAVRDLLAEVGVDMSVPVHLAHLVSVQATFAAANPGSNPDGLRCIVKMRNDVAHPERARLGRWNTYEWAEAGFLAMEFFDLALLWWLGYQGRYMPRSAQHRSYGDAIRVPWAPVTT
jgi:hypothetical protein